MLILSRPVSLGATPPPPTALVQPVASEPQSASIEAAFELAARIATRKQFIGTGHTRLLFEQLASIAAEDLGVARVVEPHLDALAIIHQSEMNPLPELSEPRWGIFASEGGPDPLAAVVRDSRWLLSGTKQWCSLASRLDAALITASGEDGSRQLFAVDLSAPGITVSTDGWFARGLSEIVSGPVTFTAVTATPVGSPGWYLTRPGFSWGGIAVAACWYGGAIGLARTLFSASLGPDPSPFLLMHLGAVDALLNSARRALNEAAQLIDASEATGIAGRVLAKRVRSTVAENCERILAHTAHALGPTPLARDRSHAKRVADLEIYLRQHHAERDDASLGETLVNEAETPW